MKKYLFSILTAFTAFVASAVEPCITNVTLTVRATASYDTFLYGDAITHTSQGPMHTYSGMVLVSDCSTIPGQCIGCQITLSPIPWLDRNFPPITCGESSTQIGWLTWVCTPACDPAQTPHSIPIVFPAHASTMSFYICLDPTANCSLSLGCVSQTACAIEPPQE